jgi:hypothetical protein
MYRSAIIVGAVVSHKFKNIIFSKLFSLEILKASLSSVQKFKIFNIFSFLSFIPSAGAILSTCMLINGQRKGDQAMMAYIDLLVLSVAGVILAILNTRKD